MNQRDAELEARMDLLKLRIAFPRSGKDARAATDELNQLKRQQRPERIEEIERERGLR